MLRVVARTNNPVLTMLNWQTIGVSLIRRKSSAHAAHGGEKKGELSTFSSYSQHGKQH